MKIRKKNNIVLLAHPDSAGAIFVIIGQTGLRLSFLLERGQSMVRIKLAGLGVEIDTESEYIRKKCSDYIADFDAPDISIKVSEEEIEKEKALYPGFSRDYYEFVCAYRAICLKMPLFNRMLMHSVVIEADGRGYAFAAKSGVGKTTHMRMWLEAFGDSVTVINGDKPIYAFENGKITAYGTPWCGKEGYQKNRGTELRAICLIKRAKQNKIVPVKAKDAANQMFGQILIPKNEEEAIKTLDMCSELLEKIPVYEMHCNISKEAAIVAKTVLDKA